VNGAPTQIDWKSQIVFESIPAVLFRGHVDGSVDLFDRKVEAITGYAVEEFATRQLKWSDLVFEEDRASVKKAFVDSLKGDKTYTREYRIRTKAGDTVWIHERSRIVCDPGGRIESVGGLFFDITERKTLEQSLRKMEQDFRMVVDNIPALTFKGYLDGTIDLFDGKVEALLGYAQESFGRGGRSWTELIREEDREGARRAFIQALKTNRTYVREYRVRAADGRQVWVHERSQIVCGPDGRAEYVSGLFFDITERKELEATVAEQALELRQANERLVLWGKELEHRNSEINLLGQMGDLLQSCNTCSEAYTGIRAFARQLFPEDSGALFVFGASAQTVESVAVWGEHPPEEGEFSANDCWSLRRGRIHGRVEVESGLRCKHVASQSAPYLCVPMMAQGAALGVLHIVLGSSDQERWENRQALGARVGEHLGLALAKLKLQESLHHMSVRDPLTGLFNRRYMEESLARELRGAERQGKPLGIIMVDIDHFKRFNDTFGHDAGDALLRELGGFFQRQTRSDDIACRFGGEEFTIVLHDASEEVTLRRAEQIREAAKLLQVRHGQRILEHVTLSMGLATFPQNGTSRDVLIQNADVALYRAKQGGRDRVCVAEKKVDS
jgi:diguanylate cyclase (GGDEF)-like protein/PAS domain S-box-containing protein